MADNIEKNQDKSLSFVRDDINSLRRDVLDIRDGIALKSERSASHLATQTTLMVIALIAVLAAAAFAFMSANRTAEIKTTLERSLDAIQGSTKDIADKYADAVEKLKSLQVTRDELARKLASTEQELSELKLELAAKRSAGEREMANLTRKLNDAQERCTLLERDARRADALAMQLEALRDDAAAKLVSYEETIKDLQQRLQMISSGAVSQTSTKTSPLGELVGPTEKPLTTKPAEPEKSLSPDDIKKMKERELEKL